MSASSVDLIFAWHDLPSSKRREIAAKFGVAPQGSNTLHLWTMQVIDAASERGQIGLLKEEIAAAVS